MKFETINKEQAKEFILKKQGLLGKHKYIGESGVLEYIEEVSSLQFDPIDICGRNADLVLFSRVKDYNKNMLENLLYKSRDLIDQWDKNMSIYSLKDFSKLSLVRKHMIKVYEENLSGYSTEIDYVRKVLKDNEFVQSNDLDLNEKSKFYTWRSKKLSQTILDYLFFKGEVTIHHRDGIKRFFALGEKYLNPDYYLKIDKYADLDDLHMFQIKRRISAVGMLSSGPSDAYLGIFELNSQKRKNCYDKLLLNGEIIGYNIEGLKEPYYILKEDVTLMNRQIGEKRLEFIAPLDNFIWDRKLIQKIFNFSYTWEIYTPVEKRIYAPYVLPILYGDDFVGRIEMISDNKTRTLILKNLWFEDININNDFWDFFNRRVVDFAKFNNCSSIDRDNFNIHYK